ncbi:hypothetical protein F2Q69_00027503 [Brassica cretica]|uniref:Uncharacterized protein n=1 Tax=Brassica cretica TaxID=69181 RepID=A0A8S9S3P8_BRACR|nr:hypothetical protein F2Q69_00027503 [Brassica cretica]
MRHHRGGADEIFSHGAMIARRSNRRSLTTRPNPCRQRRSERERESHTGVFSLSRREQRDKEMGCRVTNGPDLGSSQNRWRFVKVWTFPHTDGPAAALIMGQGKSQAHSSSNT